MSVRCFKGASVEVELVKIRVVDVVVPQTTVRREISSESLEGLTSSFHEVGLLQPILVTKSGDKYTLVAGLRRLQAAKAAGFTEMSARVLPPNCDAMQVQLIENLQREDLNPVERAEAVYAFMQAGNLSKKAAAERLGVPRTTLTDWLDLLEVPCRYREAVVDNFYGGDSPLTTSHVSEALALARSLRSPRLAEVLLDAVLQHKLSKAETREVARLVREHRDVSIEAAIVVVRGEYGNDGEDKPADHEDVVLLPHEENMKALVANLSRSTRVLERMNHVSGRFLSQETVARLRDLYTDIVELGERALARLEAVEPHVSEQRKPKKGMKSGRRAARKEGRVS